MNTAMLFIILVPIIEIYLFIKIGSEIGALNTIFLIFITAIVGIIYARYQGINTLRSGFKQLLKNEIPVLELMSGAAIALAAIFLIIPGFATDILGFFLLIPITRKIIINFFSKKIKKKKEVKNNFIDGEFEDIDDDHDRKI